MSWVATKIGWNLITKRRKLSFHCRRRPTDAAAAEKIPLQRRLAPLLVSAQFDSLCLRRWTLLPGTIAAYSHFNFQFNVNPRSVFFFCFFFSFLISLMNNFCRLGYTNLNWISLHFDQLHDSFHLISLRFCACSSSSLQWIHLNSTILWSSFD